MIKIKIMLINFSFIPLVCAFNIIFYGCAEKTHTQEKKFDNTLQSCHALKIEINNLEKNITICQELKGLPIIIYGIVYWPALKVNEHNLNENQQLLNEEKKELIIQYNKCCQSSDSLVIQSQIY